MKLIIIFSDGEYNTENPKPLVKELKDRGVIIATCFLNEDSKNARMLFT